MLARSCGRGYVPGNEGSPRRMVQYMLLLVACVGSMRQPRNSTWALESSTTPPAPRRAGARGARRPTAWTDEEVAERMNDIMASMDASGKGDIFREGHPWHMKGYVSHISIGQATPDPVVYTLDGKAGPLSASIGDKPTVLNLGSYT
jgi:hypothetical protein